MPVFWPGGRLIRLGMLLAAGLLLSGSVPHATRPAAPGSFDSDVYVWQRRWPPELAQTIAGTRALFAGWHVLAAEYSADGTTATMHPDWELLPGVAIPVFRIEGRLTPERAARLAADIAGVLTALPRAGRASVEIDHDAATSQLTGYTAFLRALRAALPQGTRVAATVLPTWIGSGAFPGLAAALDELVLQVHAVDDPRLGMFDADRALTAVRTLSRRTHIPFRVALPAYGARVDETPLGVRVASEAPVLDGQPGAEIAPDPARVAGLIARLRADPPAGMAGLIWFRLPLPGDRRAWSIATLRAVVLGRALTSRITVKAGYSPRGFIPSGAAADRNRPRTIVVSNTGGTDGLLPKRIALPSGCPMADGVGQYVADGGTGLLLRGTGGLLRPGGEVEAGWMRCDGGEPHAED